MKKIYSIVALIFLCQISFAQQPIKWTFSSKKINEKAYDLQMLATIEQGWFIYSQFNPKMGGPTPTTFKFDEAPYVDKEKLKENGVIEEKFDSAFNMELKFYRNKVNFVKRITLKGTDNISIKGTVTFMGCNAEMCLPPQEVEFSIPLGKLK